MACGPSMQNVLCLQPGSKAMKHPGRSRVISSLTFLRLVVILVVVFAHDVEGITNVKRMVGGDAAFVSAPISNSRWKGREKLSTTSVLMSNVTTTTSNNRDGKLLNQQSAPNGATVLSHDPLIYIIPNLLSDEECQSYIHRVRQLEVQQNRSMTRSNPPEVSLDTTKLWPLPILAMGFGVPPLIRIMERGDTMTLNLFLSVVLPPVAIALFGSTLLAFVVVSAIRAFSDSSSRTSDAMALNDKEDVAFVHDLVHRVESATNHPWHSWEAPVVTRYQKGAAFAKHGDASPTKGSEWADLGGQRVVSSICYLNSLNENGGGETYFDKLDITVSPARGSALFFFPANGATLEADDMTTHESKPPTQEEKWIVQMFGRVGPRVPPPLGLPNEYADVFS